MGGGECLKSGINRLIMDLGLRNYVECVGLSPKSFVISQGAGSASALAVKSLVQQEMLKRGVLALSAAHCITFSHTVDDIEYALGAYQEAFEVLEPAISEDRVEACIEGGMIQPVF